jgi:hypothetical protein
MWCCCATCLFRMTLLQRIALEEKGNPFERFSLLLCVLLT